ncbi:MAG: hypothetical protein LUD17_10590 [Bacteroidales bacterium]|nr:hypothetical protein [Bacteroidales bacterium]
MNQKLLSFLAVGALLAGAVGCNDDDDWKKVDGADPTLNLLQTSIRTEGGQTINISGTLTDADGISTILLWCPDIYLKKTIDIIEIYGEPLTSYDLNYDFKLQKYKTADQYDIEVTVTDICGNETTQTVVVTLDGDYTAPTFTVAPSAETTVLMGETTTSFSLEFTVTDNIGLDYLIVSVNKYDLSTKEIGESISSFYPMTVELYGKTKYSYCEEVEFDNEEGAYIVQVEAYDLPAQNNEVRSSSASGTITVLGGVDFSKMYLADVATAEELNADVFGVPMRVDRVGECQYRARYYNQKANTEIYFIPQKGALSPICYGIDPTDDTKFINSPGNVLPLVLPQANTYYEINFNTDSGEYSVATYEVADYMDPVFWDYGSDNLNMWFSYVDTGTDDWVSTDDAWMQEFYFGYATGPTDVIRFTQDSTNPHLYYWDTPQSYSAGDELNFMIQNYHSQGWWNFVSWRVDDSSECDIFYYYGNAIKQAYLDWYWGEDVADWKMWRDSEDYRKQLIYGGSGDKWAKPTVNNAGDYYLYFDTHLGRAKLVPNQP